MVRRVIAAIDLGLGSEQVARFAAELARGLDVELVMLHVISPEEQEERGQVPGGSRYVDVMMEETETALRTLAERIDASGPTVRFIAQTGDPIDQIRAATTDSDEIVVIGMRPRSRVGKFLLGSQLQEVLLSSTQPLVVVPIRSEADHREGNPAAT